MKFFQSKKSRRLLLFIGLPLLILAGYIGYELYLVTQTMQQIGEAMEGVADLFSAFQVATPDSTTTIDSTQILTDSIIVK